MINNQNFNKKIDSELVVLTLADQDNFLYLTKRYENRLLRYIKRISGFNQEEAEDILQDTFIKVYQNLNNFDDSLKFSSWIYRITHNQVISHHRKIKARPEYYSGQLNEEILHNLASDLDIAKEVDKQYLHQNINKILANLDFKYREILVLRFLEERGYKEISDILKKPAGTVATLLNRAKKRFTDELIRQNINF